MKKLYTVTLFLILSQLTIAQDHTLEWAKGMAGSGSNIGFSITTDTAGNVYTIGRFSGIVDFDPGSGSTNLSGINDIFIQKLDVAGNFLWVKQMGGTSQDEGYSITTDAVGNVYSTGYFQGTADFDPGAGTANLTSVGGKDVFIQKLDTAGNLLWVKQIGSFSNDCGNEITTDADGNVYSTGYFQGTVDFDPDTGTAILTSNGSYDIFIQKLDAAGNFLWVKQMGGTSQDEGCSITIDAGANVYTTGHFQGTADFDPGIGIANLTSGGNRDIFIQKLDSAGNFLWVKQMGGTSTYNDAGYSNSITTDAGSNIFITGGFYGTVDFDPGVGIVNLTSAGSGSADIFIQKLDSSGNLLWVKQMGKFSGDQGLSITTDVNGNSYTTGYFRGIVDFDPNTGVTNLTSEGYEDIFIQKLDSAGNFIWVKQMGDDYYDEGYSITTDASGNIYTTGFYKGSVDFDPGAGTYTLPYGGSLDIFVQKLSQCFTTTGTDVVTICDSYFWQTNSNTYTTSGIYKDTLINASGCDSVVTLYLTINNSDTTVISINACDSFLWSANNINYTVSGTYTTTLLNSSNCDSIIILNLSICNSTSMTINPTSCFSYISPSGKYIWTTSGTYIDTIPNAAGCDSIISINLIVNNVDTSITQSGITLTANASLATYQWLICGGSYIAITGDTNQVFTPIVDGYYAVEITENGCVDTSACYLVTGVGIIENDFGSSFNYYPNPTSGKVSVDLGKTYNRVDLKVSNTLGQIVLSKNYKSTNQLSFEIKESTGIYFVEIRTDEGKSAVFKVMKE